MASKERRLINSLRSRPQPQTPIASDLFLPNHSGVSSHPELKKYVSDNAIPLSFTKSLYFEDPEAGDEFLIAFVSDAATITEVWSETETGYCDWNIEKRSHGSAESSGTDINSSEYQASASGQNSTSISSPSVSADTYLTLTVSTVTTATQVWVAIKYTNT